MLQDGDSAGARAALAALLPVYPQLHDYVLYDLARPTAPDDPARADTLYQQLLETQPASVLAPEAALALGRSWQSRDAVAATGWLDAARDQGDAPTAMAASLALADLALARGDRRAAAEHLSAARSRAPGTPPAREAKARLLALRAADPSLQPRGDERQRELQLLMSERDYVAAEELAATLDASAPPSEQARWLRTRADALRGAGRFEDALGVLRAAARQTPPSADAAEAQFVLATWLWNRDRNAEAAAELRLFAARYPGNAHMPEVLYALGRIAQGDAADDAAVATYRRLIDSYPNSAQAREARWRIGWIRYRAGQWNAAAQAFAAAAGRDTNASADAVYWEARARERAGDRAAAQALYRSVLERWPASYYALWAAKRLGAERGARRAIAAAPAQRAIGAAPSGADDYHWIRARELAASGLRPAARRELRAYERANGADVAGLLAAYAAADGYQDAIRMLKGRSVDDSTILYPLAFWPQVSEAAAREQIDPLLILALMRQESLFDPSARSPADAFGLMQLLPVTATRVAAARGESAPGDRLTDPQTNIALGAAYLGTLLRQYDGDPQKALAAYNGGEDAVARWQERFGGLDGDEWVESITYRETRDYVKKVMGNYQRYQQIYAP
jgi:soluble lytic murein transglycosylase